MLTSVCSNTTNFYACLLLSYKHSGALEPRPRRRASHDAAQRYACARQSVLVYAYVLGFLCLCLCRVFALSVSVVMCLYMCVFICDVSGLCDELERVHNVARRPLHLGSLRLPLHCYRQRFHLLQHRRQRSRARGSAPLPQRDSGAGECRSVVADAGVSLFEAAKSRQRVEGRI